jgi:hypothetical protein
LIDDLEYFIYKLVNCHKILGLTLDQVRFIIRELDLALELVHDGDNQFLHPDFHILVSLELRVVREVNHCILVAGAPSVNCRIRLIEYCRSEYSPRLFRLGVYLNVSRFVKIGVIGFAYQ